MFLRDRVILIGMITMMILCLFISLIFFPWPGPRERELFASYPKDRPLIENVNDVLKARKGETVSFHIGSEHYVIANMPKEYIDYSSWYCRTM